MSASSEFFKAKIRTAALNSVRDGIDASAKMLQTKIKQTLNQGKSNVVTRTRVRNTSRGAAGSTYRQWVSGAPAGAPPYKDTGNLGRSITVDTSKLDSAKPSAQVGTNVVYAPALEFGSRRNAPHPFMRPTLADNQKAIKDKFQKVMAGQFRRYMR